MITSLSDRVLRYVIFCPRCSFKAVLNVRQNQIRDHIDLACPCCRKLGLDGYEPRRRLLK